MLSTAPPCRPTAGLGVKKRFYCMWRNTEQRRLQEQTARVRLCLQHEGHMLSEITSTPFPVSENALLSALRSLPERERAALRSPLSTATRRAARGAGPSTHARRERMQDCIMGTQIATPSGCTRAAAHRAERFSAGPGRDVLTEQTCKQQPCSNSGVDRTKKPFWHFLGRSFPVNFRLAGCCTVDVVV